MGLASAFLAVIETLHSEVSAERVQAFAAHLEDWEGRLATVEQHLTAKAAAFVERDVVPAVQAVTGGLLSLTAPGAIVTSGGAPVAPAAFVPPAPVDPPVGSESGQ